MAAAQCGGSGNGDDAAVFSAFGIPANLSVEWRTGQFRGRGATGWDGQRQLRHRIIGRPRDDGTGGHDGQGAEAVFGGKVSGESSRKSTNVIASLSGSCIDNNKDWWQTALASVHGGQQFGC